MPTECHEVPVNASQPPATGPTHISSTYRALGRRHRVGWHRHHHHAHHRHWLKPAVMVVCVATGALPAGSGATPPGNGWSGWGWLGTEHHDKGGEAPVDVPEPATGWILLAGAAGLLLTRRRA